MGNSNVSTDLLQLGDVFLFLVATEVLYLVVKHGVELLLSLPVLVL